jgi:hypothetical protein
LLEDDRAVTDVLAQDVVMDVHHLDPRCDPKHHTAAHPHELILEPVVRQKCNYLSLFHARPSLLSFATYLADVFASASSSASFDASSYASSSVVS